MRLTDFKGWYFLTGVDFLQAKTKDYGGSIIEANICRFILNDITYQTTENPQDGYRSCMRDIKTVANNVANTFDPVWVLATYQEYIPYMPGDYDPEEKCNLTEFIDCLSNKIILRIGTGNTDDYYPYYIAEFIPENMFINQNK